MPVITDEARLAMVPMFNPQHRNYRDRREAMRHYELAMDTLNRRSELMANLVHARSQAKVASNVLRDVRRLMARAPDYDPALFEELFEHRRAEVKQAELEVLASHDRLWVAQRAVALWDNTYGPYALGLRS